MYFLTNKPKKVILCILISLNLTLNCNCTINADGWTIYPTYFTRKVSLELNQKWSCKSIKIRRSMVGQTNLIEVAVSNFGVSSISYSQENIFAIGWKDTSNTTSSNSIFKENDIPIAFKSISQTYRSGTQNYLRYEFTNPQDEVFLSICRMDTSELDSFGIKVTRKRNKKPHKLTR